MAGPFVIAFGTKPRPNGEAENREQRRDSLQPRTGAFDKTDAAPNFHFQAEMPLIPRREFLRIVRFEKLRRR